MFNKNITLGKMYKVLDVDAKIAEINADPYKIIDAGELLSLVIPLVLVDDKTAIFWSDKWADPPFSLPFVLAEYQLFHIDGYITLTNVISYADHLKHNGRQDFPGEREIGLSYTCPECANRWHIIDTADRLDHDTVYDALPCPDCGALTGGVYSARVGDVEIPLYRGPLT